MANYNLEYNLRHLIYNNSSHRKGGGKIIDFKIVIGKLLFGEGHMWFLYMILWLYMITPIIRRFVNHENITLVKYFIILGLLMCFTRPLVLLAESVLPFNTSFLDWMDKFHADFVGGFTVYYITGWYLHNYALSAKFKKILYLCSILSITIVIALVNILPTTYVDIINSNESILIYVFSCGVYVWLQAVSFPAWVHKLAPYVFGIYIIHPILIFLFNTCSGYANNAYIYLVKWIVVSLLSCILVYAFSKVKYLRSAVKA